MQIRHNPLSGGYCGEVPPLPIPNREVKLTCADGTAMQCGRVGSRLLSISEASITKVVGAFCFHADCFFSHADFADDADFSLMLFLFPTDFTDLHRFWTCSVWDFADDADFLPFYFFTFLPLYLSGISQIFIIFAA